jgi:outer membrane protein assembly factor BamB
MTTNDRDALIRAALTPSDDVRLPDDLPDQIYRTLVATPQRRPRLAGLTVGRWLPQLPPGVAWLLIAAAVVLAALAILAIASRPRPSLFAEVVNYHGNAGLTGEMPGPGPKGSVAIKWQADLSGPLKSLNMPLVQGGRVYVADGNGSVTTLDAMRGGILRSTTGFGSITGTPAIVAGRLIVAADDGTVVGLDTATGVGGWRHAVGAPTLAPLAAVGDEVLVGSDDGFVHVLDISSGMELRKVDAGGSVQRSPAIADGVAYVGVSGGRITAFDVATGAIRWTVELGDGEVLTPAVAGGVVYVAHGPLDLSKPHEVVALNAADRSVRWRWPGQTVDRLFLAGVAGGAVFVASEDHNVYRIDAATGTGGLFFATDGSIGSLAAIADGTLYISSADRHVYAIDPVSGAAKWKVEVKGTPTIPVVVDGRVFVGTDLGKIIAIEGTSTP